MATLHPPPRHSPRISPSQIAAFRLLRHHLARRAAASSIARVSGDMAGVQAQVMSAAQMSLWTRTRHLRPEDVHTALWRDRTLAKVWCMRGTSYLVPSKDVAVFVRGCERRANRSLEWLARAGIDLRTVDRISDALRDILDRPLTRKEIAMRLVDDLGAKVRTVKRGGWGSAQEALEIDGQVLTVGGLVWLACSSGIACAGPERGNQATYVRLDGWLSPGTGSTLEAAEAELLRRYLRAHGPAAAADFAWWTYMRASDAREVWGRLAPELAEVDVNGRHGWVLRSDLPALERASLDDPVVRLLPYFDSFLLGHKDKGHLVDAAHYKRVYRPAGWVSPVVLVDGRAAGVWAHARKGRRLAVRIEAFRPLSAAVRAGIKDEAEDLRRFLDADEVAVTFT